MMFLSAREIFIKFWFDPDPGSRLHDLISPVGVSLENTLVLSVCQYDLSGFATACLLGVYGLSWHFPVLS